MRCSASRQMLGPIYQLECKGFHQKIYSRLFPREKEDTAASRLSSIRVRRPNRSKLTSSFYPSSPLSLENLAEVCDLIVTHIVWLSSTCHDLCRCIRRQKRLMNGGVGVKLHRQHELLELGPSCSARCGTSSRESNHNILTIRTNNNLLSINQ